MEDAPEPRQLRPWLPLAGFSTVLVAAIAFVPLLGGGSAATAGAACPATFGLRETRDMPVLSGPAQRMVPDGPSGAVICRYQPADLGGRAAGFVGSRPLADVPSYAARLNRVAPMRERAYVCMFVNVPPIDLVLFRYPGGAVHGVWVDHGCKVMGNGRRIARVGDDLLTPLDAPFPKTSRPLAVPSPMRSVPALPPPRPTPTSTPSALTPVQMKAIGCAPDRQPVRDVHPSPAARAATDETWGRIESWLRAHAPVTYATLRPPANATAIGAAQARLGTTFPDDLVASLLRHDGVTTSRAYSDLLPYMYSPLPVAAITSTWKMLCGITRTMHDTSGMWWHGRLVPIAEDGTGVTLVTDPTAGGRVGVADDENGLEFDSPNAWPSYLAALQATAHALETNTPIRGWAPAVEAGGLTWQLVKAPTRRS